MRLFFLNHDYNSVVQDESNFTDELVKTKNILRHLMKITRKSFGTILHCFLL